MFRLPANEDEYTVPGEFILVCPECKKEVSADCIIYKAKDEGYGFCESYTECPLCRKRVDSWEIPFDAQWLSHLWDELGDTEFVALAKAGIEAKYKTQSIWAYGEV